MIQSVLARRLIYPLHERLLKRPTFSYLAELERSQWLSREGMEQLQEKKLAELLKPAYQHCPWHRERMMAAGIDPEGRVSFEDLRRLPTMDKQDALTHGELMVWLGVPGG
jgi:phenylacetate-CoA ligase